MGATGVECFSEFIGTYLLILTVGCNVLGGSGLSAALSIASVLMVSIYALGTVSGAHFNPAVTLAFFLSKADEKFDVAKMGTYMAVQLVAATAAGMTYVALFGESINVGPQKQLDPATSLPGESYGWTSALLCEFFYTFLLAFTVLRTAVFVKDKDAEYFGLCIGFVIIAGGYAAGGISGGCFNPAVAFGLDVTSTSKGFHGCIWYTAAEFLGAAAAVGAHNIVAPADEGKKTTGTTFFSEFLGTFFLVFTVGLNVLTVSPAGALSIAASLMVMIYSLGGVSGGHFNPAVTVAIACYDSSEAGCPWSQTPIYFGAQLLGALVAGLCYSGITGLAFPLAPGKGYSWADAAAAEFVFTFVLCFVVLNVAVKDGRKQIFGLAIAFTIVAGGNAIGMVSGGSLNPAVSFGIDASYALKGGSFMNCLAYSAFEILGGVTAALVTKAIRPDEKQAN